MSKTPERGCLAKERALPAAVRLRYRYGFIDRSPAALAAVRDAAERRIGHMLDIS